MSVHLTAMVVDSYLTVGEILEKATRVLTEEEKAQLEVPFVGKNGTTRKLEVCYPLLVADPATEFPRSLSLAGKSSKSHSNMKLSGEDWIIDSTLGYPVKNYWQRVSLR